MKPKYCSIILLFILGLFMFTSCDKENTDVTEIEEEEFETEIITCDDWQMSIEHDGVGNLIPNSVGGTEPLTYLWSTAEITKAITVTEDGTYSLTITDAEECTVADQSMVSLADSCSTLAVDIIESQGGILTADTVGGTQPITFEWSIGATAHSITVSIEGTYTVTATDANNCSVIDSIAFTLGLPCLNLTAEITENPNGNLTATAAGGNPPYSYLWSTGNTTPVTGVNMVGTYSVTVTDNNGCEVVKSTTITVINPCQSLNTQIGENPSGTLTAVTTGGTTPYQYLWSNGAEGEVITTGVDGTYTVWVTDADGCTTEDSITISITNPCQNFSAEILSDVNGNLVTNITGGTQPYLYSWSTGENTSSISAMMAGLYSVTVTDVNGCTTEDAIAILGNGCQFFITEIIESPAGTLTSSITGGTPPYIFNWNTNEEANPIIATTDGNYSVTVTDVNGCTAEDNIDVILIPPCQNFNTEILEFPLGTLTAVSNGGIQPYSYEWSTNQITNPIIVTTGDIYSVTVTDDNGCTSIDNIEVNTINPCESLTIVIEESPPGTLTAVTSGGTTPYFHAWADGTIGSVLNVTTSGTYTVGVVDFNNCMLEESITVTLDPCLSLATDIVENPPGTLTANTEGGTQPYEFIWSTSENSTTIMVSNSDTYSVTVTDLTGCSTTDQIIATGSAVCDDLVISIDNPQGLTLVASFSGGTAPYSFFWSTGELTQTITVPEGGLYWVAIQDANDCSVSIEITI